MTPKEILEELDNSKMDLSSLVECVKRICAITSANIQ